MSGRKAQKHAETGGTEITRFNALRHGVLSRYTVLPWEDETEYHALVAALVAEHAPQGRTEEHLVEEVAGILWRKRRLRLAEAAVGYPKFAAQAIRKASELGWKPLHVLSYISQSIPAVLKPAGLENAIGIISAQFGKDPTDPRWADDPNTKEYNAWLQKYVPGGNPDDIFLSSGYAFIQPLIYLLEQCGDDLSRENIMRRAMSFHDVAFPWLLPGVTISTSPTDYQPIKTLRETRFNGKSWDLLDEPN